MAAKRKPRKRKSPLVESKTEAVLKRRGTELVGVILTGMGVLFLALLWTYSPGDPSFFSSTDNPPQNILGLVGSSLADPIHKALGWAAYGIPATLLIWGFRLIRHKGEERVVSRLIFAPIAIAICAVFASSHVPLDSWAHEYGLGGVFGDAVLRGLVLAVPGNTGLSLKVLTLIFAFIALLFASFALGTTRSEARAFARFLKTGSILSFAGFVAGAKYLTAASGVLGRKAMVGAKQARELQKERAARAAEERALKAERAAEFRSLKIDANLDPDGEAIVWNENRSENRYDIDGTDKNEARIMARIAEAVKKRETTESSSGIDLDSINIPPPPTPVGQATPELGGVTRDDEGSGPIDPNEALGGGSTPDVPKISPFKRGRAEPRVQHPERKQPPKSDRARAEEQPSLALGQDQAPRYQTPPLSLLSSPTEIVRHHLSDDALEENAKMLETVLDDYGVRGQIVSVRPGPVVTMYELEPAAGLKASRVIGLADDIARSMSALAARVSTIPGRSVIGIELPNEHREKVLLREILSAKPYGDSSHSLPLALGKDIAGDPVVTNLARMPHLLIAGTTGSGKSVAINTMILSLLYQLNPDECRLIMIDPKMLELSVYDGIPHLLSPVVTDPKKAVVALKWTVAEMEERYRKMSKMGVRNIDGYNARVREALAKGEAFTRTVQTGFDDDTGEPVFETEEYAPEALPFIVVIVDEMADLMMVAGKEIEACIQRLAQMARASGIHLIMATQRPSVDVITGTIKANFPTRISFQVTSKIDSRTILGEMGAEQLLGMGDMLYMAGGGKITRVHGPFVSDEEVEEVVNFLKAQGEPEYVSGVVDGPEDGVESEIDQVLGLGGNTNGEDALYDQAVAIVARDRKCSTSYIQRKLAIGYNKAARLVEQMEDEGVVSQANHVGKREVLVPER